MDSPLVRVGQIVGAFGIKGQVKVLPLTDFAERFDVGRRLRARNDWLTVKEALWHGTQLILTLEGVTDRTEAEALQWTYLEAHEAERPELDNDEYMTADLIGLRVLENAVEIGTVKDVLSAPAHDVFVVALKDQGEVMVPAVKSFVKSVNLDTRALEVELIPGMRPGETPEEV